MGNCSLTSCFENKPIPKEDNEPYAHTVPSLTNELYNACKAGNIDLVQQILPSMSINEINRIGPRGSTALHAACHYGHHDIVKMLLNAGAARSIRNKYNLTPFEEASSESIRKLFYRTHIKDNTTSNESNTRFTEASGCPEWVMQSKQAIHWKMNLYNCLKIDKSFDEMISFIKQHYIDNHVARANISETDKKRIEWYFDQSIMQHDAEYIVKAYTSDTTFYIIVNTHLAQFLLRFFRWNYDAKHANTLEKCVAYLSSIFIYHPDLRSLSFIGTTYRGMILSEQSLSLYEMGKTLLNKSFLSTSLDRQITETFSGACNSQLMRRNTNGDLIQFKTVFTFRIRNPETALNIESISEIPNEREVLIMPLCAFQVKSIRKNLHNDSNIHIEIEMEECVGIHLDDVEESTDFDSSTCVYPRNVC